MAETKTVEQWEKENNCIVKGLSPNKKMTKEEFAEIPLDDRTGVMHDERIEFLKRNGYEVNRENMADGQLSSRTEQEILDQKKG